MRRGRSYDNKTDARAVRWLATQGIPVKRVAVVADDEDAIADEVSSSSVNGVHVALPLHFFLLSRARSGVEGLHLYRGVNSKVAYCCGGAFDGQSGVVHD